MVASQEQIAAVSDSLRKRGIQSWQPNSNYFPEIIVADEKHGFYCLDVEIKDGLEIDLEERKKERNRKLAALLKELGIKAKENKFKYASIKVPDAIPVQGFAYNFRLPDLESPFIDEDVTLVLSIASRFGDRVPLPRAKAPVEVDSNEVKRQREELDAEQSAIAQIAGSGLSILSGVAGSGKTLVLAARANYLHQQHPKWQINVLCFNNALKPYLASLVTKSPRITVETFYEFITRHVDKFTMKNTSERAAQHQLDRMIHVSQDCDAILVDEAQDFMKAWIIYLSKKVRPHRGGILLAADSNQAIYRESNLLTDFEELSPQHFYLKKSYRSTKQIVKFINVLIPECGIKPEDAQIEGLVPKLVWVQGGLSKPDVKRAIALDIRSVLEKDPAAKLSDIGILCSRRYTMKGSIAGISDALDELIEERQFGWISPLWDTKTYDPNHDSIKMMTIHSAKGLEFKYVFLLGLEELAKQYLAEISEGFAISYKEKISNISEENMEIRLNFVGPTRASSELFVYYSKHNLFLERLLDDTSVFEQAIYPESYEVPLKWQS